jgi:type 1 glutamine amidotransferase
MIFVLKYGKGRVARNVLGHDVAVRSNESYKKILYRSVEWAATGKVTLK